MQYIAGAVLVILMGVSLLNRSAKTKEEFIKVEGTITYLDKRYDQLPTRNFEKYRYLIIDGTQRVFEIFIGNEPGDFSPEFEHIDELVIGDTITLYYDDNINTEGQVVNSLVRFIDRNKKSIFIESANKDKTLGYIVIGLGIILIVIILILKKTGKMV
ncbi:MAG: DUF3592 domain-containing protein [Bacteroidota bacterium]